MYYRHNLDYKYPERSDEHMITVKHLRDTNFDEKCSLHSSHIGSVRLTEGVNKLINMIYDETQVVEVF